MDVDQILLKSPKHAYEHFIYACPICSATIYALEAYRARPDAHMLKPGNTRLSFGGGLTSEMHARLSAPMRESGFRSSTIWSRTGLIGV